MAFNFKTSILPTDDNTFSLGSSTKRWRINDSTIPTFDAIYPIGSIYMSINSTDPSNLFGGTWEQITGKFLLACDTTYTAGTTGGSSTMSHTHTQVATTSGGPSNNTSGGPSNNTSGSTAISVAQMPSHNHGSAGGHSHSTSSQVAATNNDGDHSYVVSGFSGNAYPSHMPFSINSGGGHTHSSNGSGSGHTHTLSSHTHSLQSHTHSTSATTTGGASNTNNMPPYLAVYVWQRVA